MATHGGVEDVRFATKKRRCDDSVWCVLESGVLAVKTNVELSSPGEPTKHVWFDPQKNRLVCAHGWGQYHIGIWNGPRSDRFVKPHWTSCECKSATGLCSRKKIKSDQSSITPPDKYDTLVAMHGTTKLRPGLFGTRVPGIFGEGGEHFFKVLGDPMTVLRCKHGATSHTLSVQAREQYRYARSLVAAALFGRKLTLRGVRFQEESKTGIHASNKMLVKLIMCLHDFRKDRRARRGVHAACYCAPIFVKKCFKM